MFVPMHTEVAGVRLVQRQSTQSFSGDPGPRRRTSRVLLNPGGCISHIYVFLRAYLESVILIRPYGGKSFTMLYILEI